MNHPKYFAFLAALFLAACSTPPKSQSSAWNHAVDLAFAEAGERERLPANDTSLESAIHPDFQALRKELKVVVLPKRSNLTEKSRTRTSEEYAPALVYAFHATRLLACGKLAKDPIKSAHPAEIFGRAQAPLAGDCAILNVKRVSPELRPAEFHDDLVEMNLYLDSRYRGLGLESVVAHARKEFSRHLLALNPDEPLSSGLSLFPVDLPGRSALAHARKAPSGLPEDPFVAKQLARQGVSPVCAEGMEMKYRDSFGNPVRVFWCAGARWPSIVETRHFLAVAKN